MRAAKELQNQAQLDTYEKSGPVKLGPWTSHIYRNDPRHLGFLLARYKFCAKMLTGKQKVLEVGCGDGFGIPVILQTVGHVHGIDFEPRVIDDIKKRMDPEILRRCSFEVRDITRTPPDSEYDAAYSLDVIEHIPHQQEGQFLNNIVTCLHSDGICIIGTPNRDADKYATEASRQGHINLKTADDLRALLSRCFNNVFVFSMNDEVVHTGFSPMAHYLIAIGVGVRK